jgi:hypothetical protein
LIFNGGRYWCRLALKLMSSEDESERAKALFDIGIGVGCCSPLNSERRKYDGMDVVVPGSSPSGVVPPADDS